MLIYGVIASSYPAVSGAFESIATATGTGSSDTITFTSIPSTYKHLQIRALAKNSDGADTALGNFTIVLNSDTGSNYARHYVRGDGSTATADGRATQTSMQSAQSVAGGGSTSIYGVSIIDIHDYANTSKYKTIRYFDGVDLNGSGRVGLGSGLWMNTAAVSSISLRVNFANWNTGTTIALYGIKGA